MASRSFAEKKRLQNRFKLHGINLMSDALEAVLKAMTKEFFSEDFMVESIISEIQKQHLKSSILNKSNVEALLKAIVNDKKLENNVFTFIDAFDVPKNEYDPVRKRFYKFTGKLSVLAEAPSKTNLYRERLQLLQQKLLHDANFIRPALAIEGAEAQHKELTPLQSLAGSSGRKYILGLISQLEDGRFFLEDLGSSVPLDLQDATTMTGLYTENSMVVVDGELTRDGVLKATFLGSPSVELRDVSLEFTAGLDFFGGGVPDPEAYRKLKLVEKTATKDVFIFIADVILDDEKTFSRLGTVLDGYENVAVVPSLFVLIGNFSSHNCSLAFYDFSRLRSLFTKLGKLICDHPRIKENSRFVFVPGPKDPGPANVLPRPRLPKFFVDELSELLPTAVFASNPCRIKWYSQEIVVFREDLLYRMRRSCVVPPSSEETSDLFEHMVATVLQQSHLCPLPLSLQPIFWDYDHALRLYPLPDVVVIADSAEQKTFKYEGVTVFNPGSFSVDKTFTYYLPSSLETDENLVE